MLAVDAEEQEETEQLATAVDVGDVGGSKTETTAAEEVLLFLKLAGPSILIQVFVLLTSVQTAMFVGRRLKRRHSTPTPHRLRTDDV